MKFTSTIGGIFAYVTVYISAHLHMALLAKGNMLDMNWLQEVKELVKKGEIVFQILQNLLGGKSAKELIHSL